MSAIPQPRGSPLPNSCRKQFENSGFDLDAELLTAFLKSLAGAGRADVFMYVWTVSKFSLVLIFPMATHSRRFWGAGGLGGRVSCRIFFWKLTLEIIFSTFSASHEG